MGISLETYRLRIGCFVSEKRKRTIKKTKPNNKNPNIKNFRSFFVFICLLLSRNVYYTTSSISSQIFNNQISRQPQTYKLKDALPDQIHLHFLSISEVLPTKKACHSVYGNRALGYKIAAWNIGQGLFSSDDWETRKFAEIKLFIQEKKPDVLGII